MVAGLQAAGNALAQTPLADSPAAAPRQEGSATLRLRQPEAVASEDAAMPAKPEPPYVPGEFERYVQSTAGPDVEIRRLGAELLVSGGGRPLDVSPVVPADYLIAPGDEVIVNLWGTVDADLRLTVDRQGRIHIPRVGAITLAGVRHGELQATIARRVGEVFRNFNLSASLGQLRGIRVFVTGFVVRPGTYPVNSLSTVLAALMRAGGPSAAGSFRTIELRRDGQTVSTLDLYDLLLRGDRSADRALQAGDVIHVRAVGPQVGLVGSVNRPAVVEMKAGETVADALRYVGGFSAVADRSRLAIERLRDRTTSRVAQLELPRDAAAELAQGDVVRAFSAVDVALPTQRRSKRIRIEGEVLKPAEYVLPENSTVVDALRAAGGFTPQAYVFATVLTRESVRQTQADNYERALRDLETDLARNNSARRATTADEVTAQASSTQAATRLIDRLRSLKPSGRIVLQLEPASTELPDLALEDGDRLYVPARPNTVGVFGSVFNAASYLHQPGRSLGSYLRLAGGPTKGADQESTFVVRANGSVVSNRQGGSWFARSADVDQLPAEPGDTIFVPEELDKSTFVQVAKDWTQILYQFGIGLAGIKSAVK